MFTVPVPVTAPAAVPGRAAPRPSPAAAPVAKSKPVNPAPRRAPAAAPAKKADPPSPTYLFRDADEDGAPAATAAKPAAAASSGKPPEPIAAPYQITELDLTPRCPHCAKEMESEDSVICLHCGYNTQTRTHARTKVVYATTAGDRFLWLLPAFLCVLGICVLAGFTVFLFLGMQKVWDTLDENITPKFSLGVRVWTSICTGFACWLAARFAFRRLILQPSPPEIEKD